MIHLYEMASVVKVRLGDSIKACRKLSFWARQKGMRACRITLEREREREREREKERCYDRKMSELRIIICLRKSKCFVFIAIDKTRNGKATKIIMIFKLFDFNASKREL